MEIHLLKASITEKDLNELVKRNVPADLPVEDLCLRVGTEGITLQGMYPLFVNIHFETNWQLGIENGLVAARLTQFKALGIPGNIFKSAILKLLEDVVQMDDSLKLVGDAILVDVDRLLARQGFDAWTNLSRITCQPELLVIESQCAPPA